QVYVNGETVTAPFTSLWTSEACEFLTLSMWDREEAVQELTGDIDFSPRPPESTSEDLEICKEVNVLGFGEGSALHASDRVYYGIPDVNFPNGWARIDFTVDGDGNDRVLSGDTYNYYGLPLTGFAVQKFINGSMEGGTLANYAWLVEHKYTRIVESD
ncbi:MAG TPA: hypothetical protein VIC08_09865, partial [Cellvibrionaceae bacterium]